LAGSIDDLGHYASWRLDQLQNGEDASSEVDTGQDTRYGDGLLHENIAGQDVWWHSGAVPGYYTYVAFVPGQDRAIVFAINRYGEIETERVAAVGRNLTTLVFDGSTVGLPGSLAPVVLGAIFGVVAVLVGAVLIGAYMGVPSRVGASLPVMSLWAPDVTLDFCILLGTVFLASALVVTDQVANYSRSRHM
jgi:hypothetical protein